MVVVLVVAVECYCEGAREMMQDLASALFFVARSLFSRSPFLSLKATVQDMWSLRCFSLKFMHFCDQCLLRVLACRMCGLLVESQPLWCSVFSSLGRGWLSPVRPNSFKVAPVLSLVLTPLPLSSGSLHHGPLQSAATTTTTAARQPQTITTNSPDPFLSKTCC